MDSLWGLNLRLLIADEHDRLKLTLTLFCTSLFICWALFDIFQFGKQLIYRLIQVSVHWSVSILTSALGTRGSESIITLNLLLNLLDLSNDKGSSTYYQSIAIIWIYEFFEMFGTWTICCSGTMAKDCFTLTWARKNIHEFGSRNSA